MRHILLIFFVFTSYGLALVRVGGPYFKDVQGGVLMLRGVNVSGGMKVPPFTQLKPSDLDPLPGWGVNSIRLVFIWEAYEPKRGMYDTKYLDWYVEMANAATQRGMLVVVDLHQDGFSRFTLDGCGCGAPKWAVEETHTALKPDNGIACKGWGDKVALWNRDFRNCFLNFYANKNGIRDSFLKMIKTLATRFKNNPDVIGFDPMNEPWGSWNQHLLPLYTSVAEVVHGVSPDKIIFLEPSLGRVGLAPGVKADNDFFLDPPKFKNFAFAPHYYDLQVLITGKIWLDYTSSQMALIHKLAKKWNAPVWIGEFSAPFYSDDEMTNANSMKYVDRLYAEFNKRFFSSAQWSYIPTWNEKDLDGWNAENVSIVDGKGNLRNFRPRPTPERISGVPTRVFDDLETNTFTVEWTNEPATGETVIFAPAKGQHVLYPKPEITAQPKQMKCEYDQDGLRIHCHSTATGKHRLVVSSPKPAKEAK